MDPPEERGAISFSDAYKVTPPHLLDRGIYHMIAISLHVGEWRKVSLVKIVEELASGIPRRSWRASGAAVGEHYREMMERATQWRRKVAAIAWPSTPARTGPADLASLQLLAATEPSSCLGQLQRSGQWLPGAGVENEANEEGLAGLPAVLRQASGLSEASRSSRRYEEL